MKESPLFVRTHDFLLWLLPQMQKFPRVYRFTLSEHIQQQGMAFQDSIVWAGKSTGEERHTWLKKADVILEQLRFWMRFSHDLELINIGQYEHAARMVVEMGRLLGAWIKQA
ncbi:MAG: diversity-generating retroelement protein Avd [Anaerolineaceae bacterium]|nr:diversity-generating retroelement protein Avd [Anaerolineaceae bacterium]